MEIKYSKAAVKYLKRQSSLPTDEEVKIFDAYKKGDEDYQPFITHDDLKKELELA